MTVKEVIDCLKRYMPAKRRIHELNLVQMWMEDGPWYLVHVQFRDGTEIVKHVSDYGTSFDELEGTPEPESN